MSVCVCYRWVLSMRVYLMVCVCVSDVCYPCLYTLQDFVCVKCVYLIGVSLCGGGCYPCLNTL